MPQYTPPTLTAGATVTGAALSTELAAIAAAYNALDTTNFPTGSRIIPSAAMNLPNAVLPVSLCYQGTLSGATVYGAWQGIFVVPCSCTLSSIKIICTALSTGGDVRLNKVGTGAIHTAVTVSAAATAYSATPTVTSFVQGDLIAIEAAIGGGNSITNLRFDLAFYAQHMLTTLPV